MDIQMEMKRNFILDRLQAAGVVLSRQGEPIEALAYDDLKYELVMRDIQADD